MSPFLLSLIVVFFFFDFLSYINLTLARFEDVVFHGSLMTSLIYNWSWDSWPVQFMIIHKWFMTHKVLKPSKIYTTYRYYINT